MFKGNLPKLSFGLIFPISLLLVSCGGGGGGSSAQPMNPAPVTPPPAPTVLTGVFVDSAVQGLNYSTTTQSGSTNADGEFSYQAGETVTFSLGAVDLPAVTANTTITPLDIFSTTDINDTNVVNLSRLLQSLDTDGNPDNGIVIDDMAHTMASGLTLDFESSSFDTDVINLVANSGSNQTMLISASDAISHLSDTLGICLSDHALVGSVATFTNHFHGIGGTAEVVDNCTIEITMFTYDGEGPAVYFYAGVDGVFSANSPLFRLSDILLNGSVHTNSSFTLTVPDDKTLDDFNSISVWCIDFLVSFGDLTFTPGS